MRTDWIRIEDLSRFMIKGGIKQYHPDDPRHTPYWRKLKTMCIEGFWGEDFGGYRYMPGRLFFYGNFCTIEDTDEDDKVRHFLRPSIGDIEWERAYMYLEAEGFSGWKNDDEFTSEWAIKDYIKNYDVVKTKRNPRFHTEDGGFKTFIHPRENIRKIHDKPKGSPLRYNNTQNIIELGCLHKDTKVRMYDGSLKSSIDIEVGDQLMGIDSTPRTVQKLVRGNGIMYDTHTRYGNKYRVTDSHLHYVKKHKSLPKNHLRDEKINFHEYHNLDTNELLEINPDQLSRQYEAVIQGINYPEQKQLLHPYFIGCWLGDGFKNEKLICYDKLDSEHIEWLKKHCDNNEFLSYKIKERSNCGLGINKMMQFRLIHSNMLHKNNYWSKTFRNNKHIPNNYLYSSTKQRLELLAGMIDTDGTYERGRFRITQGEKQLDLLRQFQDLARSLGFRATIDKPSKSGVIRKDGTQCLKYNLTITGEISKIPTRISRKKGVDTKSQGSKKNHISFDLSTGKVEPFYGFELDGDSLFLLEDYTVTHNSRGGGKSYWYALGGALYRMCFDAIKFYTDHWRMNPPTAKVLVGSGRTDKSSEFCSKIEVAMDYLAKLPELGAWGKVGDSDYQPSPFYKDMKGSLKPNNKDNAWRHEYSMQVGGQWIDGYGSKSCVYHVNYSTQKKDGAEAGAGGRYTDVIYEEVGLTELVIEAYNSNRATVATGATTFGVQIFLGTSGNMETIEGAKKIFERPGDYETLGFPDVYDGTSDPIGFFLPCYMTARKFKDENGNTDMEAALAFYQDRQAKAAKSSDPLVLRVERMNYPMNPSDMWQTEKGHILPSAEAEVREKELKRDDFYLSIGTPVKLHWDSKEKYGVGYDIHHDAEPFFHFPLDSNQGRKSLSGAIMIYDFPIEVKGEIPDDMYMATHDPYVSDEWDKGGSLGVTHVWLAPRYWHTHMVTSPLVATYIGKPKGGKKEYYQNLEKLMQFYGNPPRGLWYEANRGEFCRGYFHKVKKPNLLSIRPQYEKGDAIRKKTIAQYGFMVGNLHSKIAMLDDLSDLLLQEIVVQGHKVRVIETLPCIFTVRQIKYYEIDGNFDAVSSCMGYPLYIREEEHKKMHEVRNRKRRKNPMAFFSVNSKIFNRYDNQ